MQHERKNYSNEDTKKRHCLDPPDFQNHVLKLKAVFLIGPSSAQPTCNEGHGGQLFMIFAEEDMNLSRPVVFSKRRSPITHRKLRKGILRIMSSSHVACSSHKSWPSSMSLAESCCSQPGPILLPSAIAACSKRNRHQTKAA